MQNEKRLIDANALKQRFDEREADDTEMYGVHIAECFPADDAKEIVDQMPTVDAVEVVRCKDCKYRGDYPCPMYYDEWVEWNDDGFHESEWIDHDQTIDDGFCHMGERK